MREEKLQAAHLAGMEEGRWGCHQVWFCHLEADVQALSLSGQSAAEGAERQRSPGSQDT